MAKGALYWRLKDEKTGKWTYKRAVLAEGKWMIEDLHNSGYVVVHSYQEEE